MAGGGSQLFLRRLRARWLAWGLFVTGCTPAATQVAHVPQADPSQVVKRQAPPEVIQTAASGPAPAPMPRSLPALPGPVELPMSLDTLFRLAEGQNTQITLAREKLTESLLENELASKAWIPQITAGVGYYRHEGGIQNENGTLTHSSTGALYPAAELRTEIDLRQAAYQRVQAERELWQRKGEVSKVSHEVLLEAASLYVDFLTARQADSTIAELQKYLDDLLERGEKLLETDKPARIMVESVRGEVSGRLEARSRVDQQAEAATAKLAYLLGLGEQVQLNPLEKRLAPIDLVDPTQPVESLVAQSLTTGPGVRELEGMLAVIQNGLDQLNGRGWLIPTLRLNVVEGAFGAGPGSELDWDNRLDIGLCAQWSLTDWITIHEKRRLALSKMTQAQITYQDLRNKLSAGVREAQSASLKGRQRIRHAGETIRHAAETYRLADLRLRERVPGSSIDEVLRSIKGLEQAHLRYIEAVNEYNKAQIRLVLLLGPAAPPACTPR